MMNISHVKLGTLLRDKRERGMESVKPRLSHSLSGINYYYYFN